MIKPQYKAFTLEADGKLNQLKTSCGISDAIDIKTKHDPLIVKQYEAIWDTGATGTVITKKVATELGLKPTGIITSNHAGGSNQAATYLVNIYLPNGINIHGLKVVEAVLSGNTEMLIGMDIISHGDFAFTNVGGKSCFTFRMPSIKKIDYVEEDKKKSIFKPSGGGGSYNRRKRR